MRRTLPLCLLLMLLAPAPARAVLVTGYGLATVTRNDSIGPGSYQFFVGESVYLVFQYEFDPTLPMPRIGLTAETGNGFNILFTTGIGPGKSNIGSENGTFLSLNTSDMSRDARIRLDGDTGTFDVFREFNNGRSIDSFAASLMRLAGPIAVPLPEPSTLALGLVGAGVVLLGRWRKRR